MEIMTRSSEHELVGTDPGRTTEVVSIPRVRDDAKNQHRESHHCFVGMTTRGPNGVT